MNALQESMKMFTKVHTQETLEGDGLIVNRLFPISQRMNFDPFVLWDHFDVTSGHGFSDHPHRGFEAITYVLTGGMHHKDNLGNDAFVGEGGAQVFCAGSGIVHSEMPVEKVQNIGIQLWVNLPKNLKSINPSYQQILSEDLPTTRFDGGSCRTIVGEGSPIKLHTDITYQYVRLEQNKQYQIYINQGLNAIVYVLSGNIVLGDEALGVSESLLIKANEEQNLSILAKTNSEFMFCCGLPHHESIYQHGPYVD